MSTITGNDKLDGTGDDDVIYAYAGNDKISAGAGNDLVDGGSGNDKIDGGLGNDTLYGGLGNDNIVDSSGINLAYGGSGNDTIKLTSSEGSTIYGDGYDSQAAVPVASMGNDNIQGGSGNDLIFGDNGSNLNGSGPGGSDTIDSGGGNDTVYGEGGNDTILAGAGDDVVVGGADADQLTGGSGSDRFVYKNSFESTAAAMDRITDFVVGVDKIDLSGMRAGGLAWSGAVAAPNSVWVTQSGGNTFVRANVDGNADFVVQLTGLHSLSASDLYGVTTGPNNAPALTGTKAILSLGVEDTAYVVTKASLLIGFSDDAGDLLDVSGLTASIGLVRDNFNGTFTITPTANFHGAVTLNYNVIDDKGGSVAAVQNYTIAAVADTPTLSLTQPDASVGNAAISLAITPALTDVDGSEVVSVTITGVPIGWSLSAGTVINEETGTYQLSLAQLAGLAITPAAGASGSVNLSVTAIATETSNGSTSSSASQVLTVAVSQLGQSSGQAIDGYIAGATVFADADLDGVLDTSEARATTDAGGNFTLVGGSGPLVMYGGTDVSTGVAFVGTLRAPAGSTVVTPLTTLVAALVDQGQTASQATTNVLLSFGLAPIVDLLNFDPVAAVIAGDPNAAAVLGAGIQVQNTIVQLSALLTGAGATDAGAAVITELANLAALGASITLANATTTETLINAAAETATGITAGNVNQVAAAAAGVLAAANEGVATALLGGETGVALLGSLAQVASVAQGTAVAAALVDAGTSNSSTEATAITADYTGTALSILVDAAPVGDVTGGINGTIGADILTGTSGNNAMAGLEGNDLLIGLAGNDTLLGGPGNDSLRGGPGNDVLNGGILSQIRTVEELTDLDAADYSQAAGPVTANLGTGSTSNDGDGGSDVLIGIEGLIGSAFADTLTGSSTTYYEFFRGGAGNDTIDGAGLSDRAFYDEATAGIAVTLGSGNVNAPNANGIVVGNASVGTDTLFNVEQFVGTEYADTYSASGFQSLSSLGNLPSFFNDFEGRGGNDIIVGNGGTRANYASATGSVTVTLTAATPVVGGSSGTAFGTYADAGVGTDTLSGINSIRGSGFADFLSGGTATSSQQFNGRAGDDWIDGGSGFDTSDYAYDGAISVGLNVNMAAGIVTGDPIYTGTDTLRSVEKVRGTPLIDIYDARGYGDGGALTTVNVSNSHGTYNEFEGMAGNDTIYGNGNTRITFDAAQEGVTVNLGTGTIVGGLSTGVDTIMFPGSSVPQVSGSPFNDLLIGANNISGTDFTYTEVFQGRAGNDTMIGGGGWDAAQFQSDSTTSGITISRASSGIYVNAIDTMLVTGSIEIGNDVLIGMTEFRGTNFNDVYDATGYDPSAGFGTLNQFEGGGGDDTVTGNGNTRINYSNAGSSVTVDLGAGTAFGTTTGTDTLLSGINRIRGSNFNDNLTGSANGGETIQGRNGNDFLNGGAGNDNLQGENDNDTLRGGAGNDSLDGGSGIDLIDFSDATGGITFTLSQGTNGGGYWSAGLNAGSQPGLGTDQYRNMEGVIGSAFNDSITGSSGNDTISGGLGGVDTLNGGTGDDLFYGYGGDSIDGGAGFDTLSYEFASGPATFNVAFSAGNFTSTSYLNGAPSIIDTTTSVEGFYGSIYADVFNGSSGDDYFVGFGGGDTIHGGLGSFDIIDHFFATAGVTISAITGAGTVLMGGTTLSTFDGIEAFYGSNFADTITGDDGPNSIRARQGDDTIDGGAGIDRVDYFRANGSVTVQLNADDIAAGWSSGADGVDVLYRFERIRGSLLGDDQLFGNDFDNRLEGSGGNDSLFGAGGNDDLRGDDGNDTLRGGAGNDSLDGGSGTDMLDFSDATGGITFTLSQDTDGGGYWSAGLNAGSQPGLGTDQYRNMEGVIGSAFNDSITGSSGNDTISGGLGGVDTLNGGTGDDLFYGYGGDSIDGGAGFDTLSYEFASGPATFNVAFSAGNFTSTSYLNGAPSIIDTTTSVEGFYGSIYADVFNGSSGDDYFVGFGGGDTIHGGLGSFDIIDHFFATAGVTISAITGAGTVLMGGTTLSTFDGIEAFYGSNFADTITGDDGPNSIRARQGDDTIDGGAGIDRVDYFRANGSVTVQLNADDSAAGWSSGADGVDVLYRFERIRGSLLGDDQLFGNDFDNRLEGSGGNDSLFGAGGNDDLRGDDGNDQLVGGAGSDSLRGGNGIDSYVWNLGDGGTVEALVTDTIQDFGLGGNEVIDLRGLLVGESHVGTDPGNLASYLQFAFIAGITTISIDSDGIANGAGVDQIITLVGFDPGLGANPASDAILQSMLIAGKLLTD